MTTTTRVTIDSAAVSPAKAIMAAARSGPLVILSDRAFNALCSELGGVDRATRHLLRVATKVDTPIAVNFATGEGTSSTAFIAPKGWSDERLRGWVTGHHEILEAAFGRATVRRAG